MLKLLNLFMAKDGYDRITVKEESDVKNRLKNMFPGLNYTETVEKLLKEFDRTKAGSGYKAIWIKESTYDKLNEMGQTSDDFDDVISDAIFSKMKSM